jgi:hypothetical protein
MMIRYLFLLALFMHGVGHLLFMANAWGYWRVGGGRAWLFSGVLDMAPSIQGIVGLLWIVPLVGFVAATGAFMLHDPRGSYLAIVLAIISSLMLIVWWSGLNTSSAFFALAFNILVIAVLRWRPEVLMAAGT